MTYTVRTLMHGHDWTIQTFTNHEAARKAYDRAVRSGVYQQVHIASK